MQVSLIYTVANNKSVVFDSPSYIKGMLKLIILSICELKCKYNFGLSDHLVGTCIKEIFSQWQCCSWEIKLPTEK